MEKQHDGRQADKESPSSEGGAEHEVTASAPEVTADSTALPRRTNRDGDLELLQAAWSRMPSHIRAGIMAMVRSVLSENKD